MIRRCTSDDFPAMFSVINDAAQAYRGVIPADRWKEPYMPAEELAEEIDAGVVFWGFEDEQGLCGIMGLQDKGPVTLIRHAYVLTSRQRQGNRRHASDGFVREDRKTGPRGYMESRDMGCGILPQIRVRARVRRGKRPSPEDLLVHSTAADRNLGGNGR
jgi:hypothetical protein